MHFSLRTKLSLILFTFPFATFALDEAQMASHLQNGAALLGNFDSSNTDGSNPLASWMTTLDDATPLQNIPGIPGTHDSLAWNISGLAGAFTQTQDSPLFKQLNLGVRFIDLRIGYVNSGIRLFHGSALLDSTATLDDIFWGLYHWLDAHPQETVLVSVKVDAGPNSVEIQQGIYSSVTGPDTASYWVQSTTLPTLGEARHKLVLIRRFAFDQLPNVTPVGLDLSAGFQDNNADFNILYSTNGDTVYIEDFYDVGAADLPSAVTAKLSAVQAHLDKASSGAIQNSLFWTFVSGFSGTFITPKSLAQGNGTQVAGVNALVLDYLVQKKGSHFGVVLFDFYVADPRLGPAVLSRDVDLSATPTYTVPNIQTTPLNAASTLTIYTKTTLFAFIIAFASLLV